MTHDYLLALKSFTSNEASGYFGKDSMSWKVYREPIILIGGLRALLLQIAHPAVADGVQRYSEFEKDALGRGFRTFGAMASIYFGTASQAEKTGFGLYKGHSFMKGNYENQYGEQIQYTANEPELLAWVLATLTDTTFYIGDKGLKNLPTNWKEEFFEESKCTATLMGIPAEYYPRTIEEFHAYFEKMTTDGTLQIGEAAQRLRKAILGHPLSMGRIGRFISGASLPEKVAKDYGLSPNPKKTATFVRRLELIGRINGFIPKSIRFAPAWHQANERIAKSKSESYGLLGKIYYAWGKRAQPPLGIIIE